MEQARSIDPRHAAGWYEIIRRGSVRAYYNAVNDPSLAAPTELRPNNAVLEYLDQPPEPQH
jgi:hypothetical protein